MDQRRQADRQRLPDLHLAQRRRHAERLREYAERRQVRLQQSFCLLPDLLSPHRQTPNEYWYNGTDPTTGIQYAPTAQHPWPEATNHIPGNNAATLNFGAVCQDPRLPAARQSSTCYAPEWAITNYVERSFWKNQASLNIRNEVVNDIKGQRTGTPAYYEEHMVGFNFWAGSTVTFRPELSYVHAYGKYGLRPLDIGPGSAVANLENGVSQTGKTQSLTLAADIIYHF